MNVDNYATAFAKSVAIEEVKDFEGMNLILSTILTAMNNDDDISKNELYAMAMNAIINGKMLWSKE